MAKNEADGEKLGHVWLEAASAQHRWQRGRANILGSLDVDRDSMRHLPFLITEALAFAAEV